MNKLASLFLIFIYLVFCTNVYGAGYLYCIENVNKQLIKPDIEKVITDNKYEIKKNDPYVVELIKDTTISNVLIFQQSGNSLYYYFDTEKNDKLNKNILKFLKKEEIKFTEITNEAQLQAFSKLAQKTINPELAQKYDFVERVPKQTQLINLEKKKEEKVSNALKGYVGNVERGTTFSTYLQTSVNTASAAKGDAVIAVLSQNWIYNDYVLAPQGSLVYGTVTKANKATIGCRNGAVQMNFTRIVTPEGKTYDIELEKIDFKVQSNGKVSYAAKTVAKGAILGLLAGLIPLMWDASSVATSLAVGAGVGSIIGAVSVASEKGIDAEIPSFTEIELVVDKPFKVVLGF